MLPLKTIHSLKRVSLNPFGYRGLATAAVPGSDYVSVDRRAFLPPPSGQPVAVVGGSGFVGRTIIELLQEQGETNIVNLDFAPPLPEFADSRVNFVKTDIRNPKDVLKNLDASAGSKFGSIFHVAALLSYMKRHQNSLEPSVQVNVNGTKNVLDAAAQLGIPHVVQTSTSNVCLGADTIPIYQGDESTPYPKEPYNHYTRTKVEAEKLTLAANGKDISDGKKLWTCSIRPTSVIFGFRDGTFLDGIARGTPFSAHNPVAIQDFTYVENVALAHILAMNDLRTKGKAAGRPFFVTNDEPRMFHDFYKLVKVHVPDLKMMNIAPLYPVAVISDTLQRFFPNIKLGELDKLTLGTWNITKAVYSFSCGQLKETLGYKPMYSQEQALAKSFDKFRAANYGIFGTNKK